MRDILLFTAISFILPLLAWAIILHFDIQFGPLAFAVFGMVHFIAELG